MFEVRNLGRVSYDEAWNLQIELIEKRALAQIPDTLLIVEHDHVFTFGRKSLESKSDSVPQDICGIPVRMVERGGEATYHGPGQLVAYPIFLLDSKLGPKAFLRVLEQSIVDVLAEIGLRAIWEEGKTGVWLMNGKKIASLGIAVRKNISYHGLALNLSTDLSYFHMIQPCGFDPSIMTSIKDSGVNHSFLEIASILEKKIKERFYFHEA